MGARLTSLLVALVALLLSATAAAVETPPAPTSWVTDEVGVMSEAARADLAARLRAYEQQSGHQVVVWIGRTSGDLGVEEFAVRAFEAWKLGREGLDDGVALFVFVDDRKVRIEVGYGLEDRLTDLRASRIIRETIVPGIVAGDFDLAIRSGVEAIVDTIEGQAGALPAGSQTIRGPPEAPERGISTFWLVVVGLGFLVLLVTNPRLALFFLWSMAGRHGGGGMGGGGFGGGGGRSGGGGATGGW